MAWRDSRGSRRLLFLFMISVVFGIASLVAILSLRINLTDIIGEETRTLLGADIMLETRRPPAPEILEWLESLPARQMNEFRFRSMASFPSTGTAHFSSVRAVDAPFPFYGEFETEPRLAGNRLPVEFVESSQPVAIVEEALLLQLDLEPGDSIQLGQLQFRIEAALIRIAGESEVSGFFAPRIYIPLRYVEATGLVTRGSVVEYRTALALEPEDLAPVLEDLEHSRKAFLTDQGVQVQTVEDRREALADVLSQLFDFMSLIAFGALVLGGLGIMGAIQIFLEGKIATIAILRCIGCPTRSAFLIYLVQVTGFGLLAAIVGTALGVATQFSLPIFLADFVPFEVELKLAPFAIGAGLLFGFLSALLFALLPLLRIRRIPPIRVLRVNAEDRTPSWKDPASVTVYGLLGITSLAFVLAHTQKPLFALGFVGAVALSSLLLVACGFMLRTLARRSVPSTAPYSIRLAISNLYRPGNRTSVLLLSLGMGCLLLNFLFIIQGALQSRLSLREAEDAPNVIAVDIQPDQKDGFLELLQSRQIRAREPLPVVTMRISHLKGEPLSYWYAQPESPVEDWVNAWEFRNTYRDHILPNARIAEGEFISLHDGSQPYPISIADNLLDDLGVGVGDTVTWDVQGIPIETVITSIREVDWEAGRQNFGIVFPLNSIEAAPTVFAVPLYSDSRQQTATIQGEALQSFPNVSLIDLSLFFESIREITSQASFVIRFLAGFTIATGLLVLAGSLFASRVQRLAEARLFRILGASRPFVLKIFVIEVGLLALIAALAAWLLAVAASSLALPLIFDLPPRIPWLSSMSLGLGIATLSVAIGWFAGRSISRNALKARASA